MTKKYETIDIAEDYKGYSTFIEVEDFTLRSFNRWTVLNNMRENNLSQLMNEYMGAIEPRERIGLFAISEFIKHNGLEETQRQMIKNGTLA